MNAHWRGPLLRDILQHVGIDEAALKEAKTDGHVLFASHQQQCEEADWYGGSITLPRALDPGAEVVLALEMNGEKLTPNHGFPVRVVVPGVAGARSVKWLDRVEVGTSESPNHYQQRDYKILPPEVTDMEAAEKHWDSTPALQSMPINSVISVPESGKRAKADEEGEVEVKGYALPSGEDGPVVRVDVSGDGGQTWKDAKILEGGEGLGKWCWCLWEASVKVEKGKGRRIVTRATDKGGNTQDENRPWNLRGICYNGYGEATDLEVV